MKSLMKVLAPLTLYCPFGRPLTMLTMAGISIRQGSVKVATNQRTQPGQPSSCSSIHPSAFMIPLPPTSMKPTYARYLPRRTQEEL